MTNCGDIGEISKKLEEIQQSHLLRFWSEIDEEEKQVFIEQMKEIELDNVNDLFQSAKNSKKDVENLDTCMEPIPKSHFESEEKCSDETLQRYRKRGLEEIGNGHVGVLLLAGGQGTRLGVDYPKGMLSVGLPSGKSLFQIQAERVRKLQSLAKRQTNKYGKIVWYIMTSGPTDEATEDFFKKHNYFGLNSNDVVMFKQGLLPCFDVNGKLILDDKNKISMAPDGNGGIYRAMKKNGILDDMRERNVKFLHVYSVDNILVKVGDPVFIGYCVEKGADCAAKVVRKLDPSEGVGVVCKVQGCYQVVEYSEISKETAELRDENSELVYSAGNICNHFFTRDFLSLVANKFETCMKLHVAKKKIAFVNEYGSRIKPKCVNGIKIEKFIFDVFQFTDRFVTWEVSRLSEFSAIKNCDELGKNCPSTARRDLLRLHKLYIEKAGGEVEGEEVEISPLLSYSGEDLETLKGNVFHSPFSIDSEEDLVYCR